MTLPNPEREAVARIIDSLAMRTLQECEAATQQAFVDVGGHASDSRATLLARANYDGMAARRDDALAKADQILSLPEKGWRPIETHDNSRTEVLLLLPDGTRCVGWRHHPSSSTDRWLSIPGKWQLKPIAFLPLPSPPKGVESEEKQGLSSSRDLRSTPQSGREDAPTPTGDDLG